jgi:hypothetical protein
MKECKSIRVLIPVGVKLSANQYLKTKKRKRTCLMFHI